MLAHVKFTFNRLRGGGKTMVLMEAGLFVAMGGIAFLTLMLSFKFGALLKAVSAVMFFSLALILFAGYEIAYTTETSGTPSCPPNDPCITQHYLVREDDTTGQTSGNWLAWILIVLGIMASILFMVEMLPR